MALVTSGWTVIFLKATFFLLYLHLFGHIRWARICSWIGFFFVVIAHGAIIVTSFAVANPREAYSWSQDIFTISICLGAVGLVADVAIFVLPYVVISTLPLASTKKWDAGLIFLTGLRYATAFITLR